MDAVLESKSAVVATRLHAMIYSIMQGIPTAGLIYQDKHLDFLLSVGLGADVKRLSELTPATVMNHIEMMWHHNVQKWPTVVEEISKLNTARQDVYRRVITA
jgi:polysaccharide pyruvyl transferase WcaK-like protein